MEENQDKQKSKDLTKKININIISDDDRTHFPVRIGMLDNGKQDREKYSYSRR